MDPRNIVYADEKGPLDLYRAIMRIDDARKVIFETIGSQNYLVSDRQQTALLGCSLGSAGEGLPGRLRRSLGI